MCSSQTKILGPIKSEPTGVVRAVCEIELNESDTINPYAPPAELQSDYVDLPGMVARDGQDMVIFNGATIPPRCFVTGRRTSQSVEIVTWWNPTWCKALLLAGVVPYFFFAPMVSKKIVLQVPISERMLTHHDHLVKRGMLLMAWGMGTFVLWLALTLLAFSPSFLPILMIAFLLGAVGLTLSSRQPIALHVADLKEDRLTLRYIHPACLEELPDVTRGADGTPEVGLNN